MILGTGVDIISIKRIKAACLKKSFFNKIYTDREKELFNGKNYNTLAANFAAKEAVSKAFGTGFYGFMPKDIEILRDEIGKPYAVFYGGALDKAMEYDNFFMHISLSHENEFAVAFAVLEDRKSVV